MKKRDWKKVKFLKSAYSRRDFLYFPYPVFTFCGRSNVGKSSLINLLVWNRKAAKVSSRPGKTASVNYFLVDGSLVLVDLPGYGFARRSKQEKQRWAVLMEEFFTHQKGIKTNFILLDSRLGVTSLDLQLIDWLKFLKQDFAFVLTKSDKVKKQDLRKLIRKIQEEFSKPVIPTSARTGEGRKELISCIEKIERGERCLP